MEVERRSESPLSKTRSSSRLSNLSNQDLSDDSDTALIEHVKAIKRSRRTKKKEKENGNLQLEENGKDDQIRTNGRHSPDPGSDLDDSKLNSSQSETGNEPPIVVMEISQDANNDAGDDGEMIDLEIEEVEDNVDVDDENTADRIVITTAEDIISADGETVEVKVTEINNAKSEDDDSEKEERDRDEREKTPGMTEEEVDQDFDSEERSGKSLNDTENGDDRWSVTVNIDSTDQKDLLENQVVADVTEKENEPANNSFTHKITSLLGSWSPIRNQEGFTRKDSEKGPVYYAKISGRPSLKSATPDRNLAGPSKEIATPALTRFLDDSFRVRSEPAKANRKEVIDQPNLKKYRGKRCLNTDESDEAEEGFFSKLSFRKRRKLNDSEISTSSNFFGNLFRSPFKKRDAVADVRPNESQSSESFKLSWLLTPFAFGKKKDEEESQDNVSTAEIAQEVEESNTPTTSDVEKTEIDDKPVETKENGGCLIM